MTDIRADTTFRGPGRRSPDDRRATRAAQQTALGRRPYRRPTLRDLGLLRQLTLGGSPGLGDSGATLTEQPPGGPVPPMPPMEPGKG